MVLPAFQPSSPAPAPPPDPHDPKAPKRENWQAYEANAAAGALVVSSKPVQLYLEITSRCNLRCVKCGFYWDPSLAKNGKDIAWPLLSKMEDFFAAATEVYTFGYGEMFLYPELAPLITVLKNHHCRVSGVTNGTLIRPADVVWLVATGYDHLAFSIDGATEETMQKLRGASHTKIMNVLRMIHDEKKRRQSEFPRVVVNFVAQADNYTELPELARQLAPLGVHFFGVNPLHHFAGVEDGYGAYYDKFRLGHVPRPEFESLVAEARGTLEGAGTIFESFVNPSFEWPAKDVRPESVALHVHAAPEAAPAEPAALPVHPAVAAAPTPPAPAQVPTATGLPSMYCHYPWTTLYLAASGTAKVCCYMSVGEGLGAFTGEGGIESVWNGPMLQSVREHIRDGRVHPACAQCVAHRSFENHAAAMNPIRAELFPPVPSVPIAPAEPEVTGLRRILRKFRGGKSSGTGAGPGGATSVSRP